MEPSKPKIEIRVQVSGTRDLVEAMRVGMAALDAGTREIVRVPRRDEPVRA